MSDKDLPSDALLSAVPTAEGAESISVDLFRLLSQKHGVHPGCFGAESAPPTATPSATCCGDAGSANSPGTIPVSVGAE